MKRYLRLAVLGAVAWAAAGCVSQADFDGMRNALRLEREQNADLRVRLEQADSEIKALRDTRGTADAELRDKLAGALADKDKLTKALNDLENRLRALGKMGSPLPGPLDAALQDLAASNPDILAYDPRKGMVKFASDLTFDLGSDVVKAQAAAVLAKFAGIMKLPDAARYEALVVGHTDNVRIGRPDTRAKHPTNWHLSVHRAISVKDVLGKAGVPEGRMMVGGYGEWRPVVPNGAKGAEANRRVEIYLVPSTASGIEPGAAVEAPADAPPRTPAAGTGPLPPEMFK